MSNDDKFRIENNSFNGSSVIGNKNTINVENVHVSSDQVSISTQTDEIITQIKKSIDESSLSSYEKKDALRCLDELSTEAKNPIEARDPNKIKHYWGQVVNLVKDVGTISQTMMVLAKILHL
jgi:hypothetical protein